MPRAAKPMASSSALASLLHLLHRAAQQADALFSHHVGAVLTPRQFVVLQAVAETKGLSQVEIMAATGIDRSSTADLVARLVRRGCLQRRRRRRDTRSYAVRLTPEGSRLLSLGAPAALAAGETLLSRLAAPERACLLSALAIIANDDG